MNCYWQYFFGTPIKMWSCDASRVHTGSFGAVSSAVSSLPPASTSFSSSSTFSCFFKAKIGGGCGAIVDLRRLDRSGTVGVISIPTGFFSYCVKPSLVNLTSSLGLYLLCMQQMNTPPAMINRTRAPKVVPTPIATSLGQQEFPQQPNSQ